jgi:hypothetical protein
MRPVLVDEKAFQHSVFQKHFLRGHMPKIPSDDQILPVDYLLSVQTNIQAGKPVSGDDILRMIEQCMRQPLLESARSVVRLALIPAVKTRGRPSKFGASLDLALEKVDQRYPALLRYEKRKKDRLLKSGKPVQKGESPSLLAYGRLLRHMKDEFGPMTREGLKNMHSAYRRGHFHSAENHADSEEFDTEIERLFPAVQES